MPDLITHAALGFLWKRASGKPHIASFVAGNLLPDLLSRLPAMSLNALRDRGLPLPDAAMYLTGPLHMPVGMLLSSYALAFLFPEAERRAVFANLLGGMGLHLAVDLTQFHYGVGCALFYPFTARTYELGWIGSEDTVFFALPLALLTALLWAPRLKRRAAAARAAAAPTEAPEP